MKYKVMIGDKLYKVAMSDGDYIPEFEKDIITFSIEDGILTYSLSNLSERTKYLFDNHMLGLGIFVEENPRWLNKKWRSKFARATHERRHCIKVFRINSMSDQFDLTNVGWYDWIGCWSRTLAYIFDKSAIYQEPYVESGIDKIALGLGRMHDIDEYSWAVQAFRPHKVSHYIETEVENKIEI